MILRGEQQRPDNHNSSNIKKSTGKFDPEWPTVRAVSTSVLRAFWHLVTPSSSYCEFRRKNLGGPCIVFQEGVSSPRTAYGFVAHTHRHPPLIARRISLTSEAAAYGFVARTQRNPKSRLAVQDVGIGFRWQWRSEWKDDEVKKQTPPALRQTGSNIFATGERLHSLLVS